MPGAKPTARTLKQIIAEAPAVVTEPTVKTTPAGLPVQVASAARLTATGSAKDVRHVEIDLADSGLTYLPGDSLSLAAPNDPVLVQACMTALHANGDEAVPCPDGVARPLHEALAAHVDIARPLDRTTDLLAMAATDVAEAAALRRLTDGDDGAQSDDADLLDLLEHFPSARPPLADLVRSLPALRPRLYSIASSLRATPGQVHLCVGVVCYVRRARLRAGVASAFLSERAVGGDAILALVQPSHFRLPADPATPVIMVGPRTGIAPFRAFLQERAALGIRGRCWLFFGDQHQVTDFLYRDELRGWLADGTLSRLDTAFSRDQARKLYVQDRMGEQAADLWRWLQDGGHFYVCGDAVRPQMRLVVIDPRRTATCEGADLHLPLRPGTNVALFGGLLAHLHAAGAADAEFLAAHTDGADAALAAVAGLTAARVAELCGLEADDVRRFFDWFAATSKVVTMFSQGVNQFSAGTDEADAIINVHLLTGRIGRPGRRPTRLARVIRWR